MIFYNNVHFSYFYLIFFFEFFGGHITRKICQKTFFFLHFSSNSEIFSKDFPRNCVYEKNISLRYSNYLMYFFYYLLIKTIQSWINFLKKLCIFIYRTFIIQVNRNLIIIIGYFFYPWSQEILREWYFKMKKKKTYFAIVYINIYCNL